MMLLRILTVLILLTGASFSAELSLPERPQAAGQSGLSMHGFGDREPGCQEWTDMCHTCSRGTDLALTCSNVGIACQPQAIKCSRQKDEQKK
jgi:hypothetical protein